jgi:hypothetical protein
MMKSLVLFGFLVFGPGIHGTALAQKKQQPFHHVEPAFWWIGMKNKEVQILFQTRMPMLAATRLLSIMKVSH